MKKKTLIYNLIIFFIFIFIGEIILGDWFNDKKLGLHMRGHINASINVETEIQGIKKEFIFLEIQVDLEIMKLRIKKLILFLLGEVQQFRVTYHTKKQL